MFFILLFFGFNFFIRIKLDDIDITNEIIDIQTITLFFILLNLNIHIFHHLFLNFIIQIKFIVSLVLCIVAMLQLFAVFMLTF